MTQDTNLPLAGLQVLELHAIGPVPFAAWCCARSAPPSARLAAGRPGPGRADEEPDDLLNAGKLPLVADLKQPEGQRAVREAIGRSTC